MNSKGIMLLPKARDYPRTFVARSRRGNLIIFQKQGKSVIPLFLLKPNVKIPARLNLGRALDLLATRFADEVVEQAFRQFQKGSL